MKRYFVIVEGMVQGVGFRHFAQTTALQHQCTGYVRNLDNGMVEIQVQSTEENINQFLRCLKNGNRFAKVSDISIKEVDLSANDKTFVYRFD